MAKKESVSTKYSSSVKDEAVEMESKESIQEEIVDEVVAEESKELPVRELAKFRLVIKNPFGKYRKIGKALVFADEVQAVIDSGNLRNCCKSKI